MASPPKFPASFASFAWHRPASPSAMTMLRCRPPGVASPRRKGLSFPFSSLLFIFLISILLLPGTAVDLWLIFDISRSGGPKKTEKELQKDHYCGINRHLPFLWYKWLKKLDQSRYAMTWHPQLFRAGPNFWPMLRARAGGHRHHLFWHLAGPLGALFAMAYPLVNCGSLLVKITIFNG